MEEELGGTFVVAVDELGLNGLWSTVNDVRTEYYCDQQTKPQGLAPPWPGMHQQQGAGALQLVLYPKQQAR